MKNECSLYRSQEIFSEMLESRQSNSSNEDLAFRAIIDVNPRIPGQLASDIYRNNSIGARTRALAEIYPVVEKILGKQCFAGMAQEFVTASPSIEPDLNRYGENFPSFLCTIVTQQKAFTELPYLPDLATLEWYFHAAYYAMDDLLFTPTSSSEIDTSVILAQSHSLHCFSTAYPVYAIWQGHQGNEQAKQVTAINGNEYILISRQQGHPIVEKVTKEDCEIIHLAEDKKALEGVVEMAVKLGLDIQNRLPAMIEQGWLILSDDGQVKT